MVVRRDVWMIEDAKTNNIDGAAQAEEREGGGRMPFDRSGAGPLFSNWQPSCAETQMVESLGFLGDDHHLRPARTSPGECQYGPDL
jgi:hypothetical protein